MAALPWILAWYALASLVTFAAFAADKRAAERGTWRTRERTLHALEFIGGWPGAFLGMSLLRHKNRKWTFWLVTAMAAVAHAAGWLAWYAWRR